MRAIAEVSTAVTKGDLTRSITVRRIASGVGVERTFPVHSPTLESIEVVTRGDVRRSKLYYLRNLRGKAARIDERRDDRRGERKEA